LQKKKKQRSEIRDKRVYPKAQRQLNETSGESASYVVEGAILKRTREKKTEEGRERRSRLRQGGIGLRQAEKTHHV